MNKWFIPSLAGYMFMALSGVPATPTAIAGGPACHSIAKAIVILEQRNTDNRNIEKPLRNYVSHNLTDRSHLSRIVINIPLNTEKENSFSGLVEIYGEERGVQSAVNDLQTDMENDFHIDAYWVRERLPKRYTQNWPTGTATPGMRLISLIHRRSSMTRDEFDNYWQHKHTKVALSHSIPPWNYSQNTVIKPITKDSPDIDGIVGMQFLHETDMRDRWLKTPWKAIRGIWDGMQFMDMGSNRSSFMKEVIIKSGAVEGSNCPLKTNARTFS